MNIFDKHGRENWKLVSGNRNRKKSLSFEENFGTVTEKLMLLLLLVLMSVRIGEIPRFLTTGRGCRNWILGCWIIGWLQGRAGVTVDAAAGQ